MSAEKTRAAAKFWLEFEGKPLIGSGGAEILEAINEEQSISKAAKKLGMSYRYVWNYVARMNTLIGQPVIETFKGGKKGGGGAKLTEIGELILKEYNRIKNYIKEILYAEEHPETIRVKAHSINKLKGTVKSVEKDNLTSKVKVEINTPVTVTALMPAETLEHLSIHVGDVVEAVINSSDITLFKVK
jgi:molybdate transport system regulatory protein